MSDPIILPIKGDVIPITDVPDKIFSGKMLGDGFAIVPKDGLVVSPVTGTIVKIFPTKHGVVLLAEDGKEILIHFGLDTVVLGGNGFKVFVNEGEAVTAGQSLFQADLEYLKENAASIITSIVFTNLKDDQKIMLNGQKVSIQ